MSNVNVEIKGLTSLKRALTYFPSISKPFLQKAIDATNAVFAKNTLKNDPVPYQTGNLLQSFSFETGDLWARWFPKASYARFVNDGTRYIEPRRFMEAIVSKSQKQIDGLFQQAGDQITSAIAKSISREAGDLLASF